MRAKKAKKLRAFVKSNFSTMPEREYDVKHIQKVDGTRRSIVKLIEGCQRRIYQKLKRETTSLSFT